MVWSSGVDDMTQWDWHGAVGYGLIGMGHVLVAGGAFSPSISVSSCLLQCALGDGSGQEQGGVLTAPESLIDRETKGSRSRWLS